jgi:hypothetical protein
MQAGFWKVHRLSVRILSNLEGLHTVEKRAGRIGSIRILIAQRACRAGGVPFLATGHAGMAAYTDIEINHQG